MNGDFTMPLITIVTIVGDDTVKKSPFDRYQPILGGCGSGVEPPSCYWKVAGSVPLVCMLKCPWARY